MKSRKHLFDIPSDVIYLNAASISPITQATRDAGVYGVERKRTPWSLEFDDFFKGGEAAKQVFSQLINATSNDIALIPSVSYGLQIAANNIPVKAGQNIVILEDQYPSDYYCWKDSVVKNKASLKTVLLPADYDWTSAILEAIDDNTAIVSTPNCHWTDGTIIDLCAVGKRCRDVGAALVVDATQSLGVCPFDIEEVQPDFLVCANYKWLLGPYSVAFLYVAPGFQGGAPLEFNPFSKKTANDPMYWFGGKLKYVDAFREGARRFDCGESANFILLPMVISAIEQILDWGVDKTAQHLQGLTQQLIDVCAPLGLRHAPMEKLAGHMVGFRFDTPFPVGLHDKLEAEGIYIGLRGNCMRISPHIYNDAQDIKVFGEKLKMLL